MTILAVPLRLRLASLSILVCIPLASLQSLLVSGSPWWDLPYRRAAVVAALAAGLFVPLSVWVTSGKRWALSLAASTGTTWVAIGVLNAVHLRTFWVATFVIGLAAFWVLLVKWLNWEMSRSFLDPRSQWFHGGPESIPGLKCRFKWGDLEKDVRVCRLDRDGTFVFDSQSSLLTKEKNSKKRFRSKIELEFEYRGHRVKAVGTLMSMLGQNKGFGIRFDRTENNQDQTKKLGDFVEILIGSGHA